MSKRFTRLHEIMEYARKLPWSTKHLGVALEGIDEDTHVNVPSPDDDGEGGRK